MNTPPPRHAPLPIPLSRHTPENSREHTSVPVALTPEDAHTWKEALYQDMASYNTDSTASTQTQQQVEHRNSLARLALASGTGEDVAAFDTPNKRPRLRLEGKSLHALALLLAVVLAGTWIYLGIDGRNIHADSSSSGPQNSASHNASVQKTQHNTSDSTGKKAQGATGDIVVYISGAVVKPGVYTLPTGSRVNDCVEAAGGLKENAQSAAINLASALSDGDHVHIPADGEEVPAMNNSVGGEAAGGVSGKININTASAAQLEDLPGIGPALSQAIVTWREDNGRFSSPEDLLEVSGIGQAKYGKLKDLVTVG